MSYCFNYDLVVDEDEIGKEAKDIANHAKSFEDNLNELSQQIENISKTAIMNGSAADNITQFVLEINGLKNEATRIAKEISDIIEKYVASIDKADDCVY